MSVNFDIQGSARFQVPICAICTGGDKPRIQMVQEGKGIRHWPYEGHIKRENIGDWEDIDEKHRAAFKGTETNNNTVRDETPNNVTPVTKRGRPKKYATRAEQQKAYRERRQ